MLYTKEQVENLIRAAIEENYISGIFTESYADDGDGYTDYMGIDFDEKNFRTWFENKLDELK